MAANAAGVLPFVRGIDLSFTDASDFPGGAVKTMRNLKWLTMTSADVKDLQTITRSVDSSSAALERLDLRHNAISAGLQSCAKLTALQTLNLSHNRLDNEAVLGAFNQSEMKMDGRDGDHNRTADVNSGEGCVEPSLLPGNAALAVLDLSYNNISCLPAAALTPGNRLTVINLSHNSLASLPPQILSAHQETLSHLDVSHNRLTLLAPQLRRLTRLVHLDVSHNPMNHFQMRALPFLTRLRRLSLAYTEIDFATFPSNLDQLVALTDLDLSGNRLTEVPDAIFAIPSLTILSLASNELTRLSDRIRVWAKTLQILNVSRNQLTSLPAAVCRLSRLRSLYVNSNRLNFDGMPPGIGKLAQLTLFSAADNELETIPESLCRCPVLKKLILTRNRLVSLPESIYLTELEVMDLRDNPDLKMPLRVNVASNEQQQRRRVSSKRQPSSSVELKDDANGDDDASSISAVANADLDSSTGLVYYNIDFDLEHQLQLAGSKELAARAAVARENSISGNNKGVPPKDAIARKMRLRRLRHQTSFSTDSPGEAGSISAAQVLRGMRDVATIKDQGGSLQSDDDAAAASPAATMSAATTASASRALPAHSLHIDRPTIDYSSFFDDDVGQLPGLTFWHIDNFYPNQLDDVVTELYEGDCYIVLDTHFLPLATEDCAGVDVTLAPAVNNSSENHNDRRPTALNVSERLTHHIYYWIGSKATLDKVACAAMHAVNLRNHLDATTRTSRQEQGDEDVEFRHLFPGGEPAYKEGARTECGFFTADAVEHETRVYIVLSQIQLFGDDAGANNSNSGQKNVKTTGNVEVVPVKPAITSLMPGNVYIIDAGRTIVTWVGERASTVLTSKACFLAEKINKEERKNGADVRIVRQASRNTAGVAADQEQHAWLRQLFDQQQQEDESLCNDNDSRQAAVTRAACRKTLYRVEMGIGYLELHQVAWLTRTKMAAFAADERNDVSRRRNSVASAGSGSSITAGASSYLDYRQSLSHVGLILLHIKRIQSWQSWQFHRDRHNRSQRMMTQCGKAWRTLASRNLVTRMHMSRHLLDPHHVYILDNYNSDVFVWSGGKSSRLLRVAASRLTTELFGQPAMSGEVDCESKDAAVADRNDAEIGGGRPAYAVVNRLNQGTEPIVFKAKFADWSDVLAVDFSRTAESVRRTGADLVAWAKKQATKSDLTALFRPPAFRQPSIEHFYARVGAQLRKWNNNLEKMEAYVLEGRNFVRLSAAETGIFYSGASYVYLCRYVVPAYAADDETQSDFNNDVTAFRLGAPETVAAATDPIAVPLPGSGDSVGVSGSCSSLSSSSSSVAGGRGDEGDGDEYDDDFTPNDFQCVVYFWQGRDCSNMGWLTFTFGLQKKFEALFGDKLHIVRMHQQQVYPLRNEIVKFVSHFVDGIVIRSGQRCRRQQLAEADKSETSGVELFQVRSVIGPGQLAVDHLRRNSGNDDPDSDVSIDSQLGRRCIQLNISSVDGSGQQRTSEVSDNKPPANPDLVGRVLDGRDERRQSSPRPDQLLNSDDVFIVRIPFTTVDGADNMPATGITYIWTGRNSSTDDLAAADALVQSGKLDPPNSVTTATASSSLFAVQIIAEGEEPVTFFWAALDPQNMRPPPRQNIVPKGCNSNEVEKREVVFPRRLFRCSNSAGFFRVTECCVDFCQDDLASDDIMILDAGLIRQQRPEKEEDQEHAIFVWIGDKCSEIEAKLGYRSAQVYVDHLRLQDGCSPSGADGGGGNVADAIARGRAAQRLLVTFKGRESRKFRRCFAGWSHFRQFI